MKDSVLGFVAELFGCHWYPECGHVSGKIGPRQACYLQGLGWNGLVCLDCFAICHFCRKPMPHGEEVTAGVIPAPIPEGTKTAQLLGEGEFAVAQMGNHVLVLATNGNARVGCSRPECLLSHGDREIIGTLGAGCKITPLP